LKIVSVVISIGGTCYCWVTILSIAGEMEVELANNFAFAFLASYLLDLFIIEIILILIKIVAFPEVEKKVRQKDSPIIFNLLYFMMAVGTSGARNGFF
jgi:hypothetical protein